MMALQSLYKDEKFSDLTVSCGPEGKSRTFKLHRAVICPQSPFFDKACTSGFQESFTNHIDLPDDDVDVFEKLVEFAYTSSYTDGAIQKEGERETSKSNNLTVKEVQEMLDQGSNRFSALFPAHSEPTDLAKSKYSLTQRSWTNAYSSPPESLKNALLTAARVYTMADKFLVPALKLLALDRFYAMLCNINYGRLEDGGEYLATVAQCYHEAPPDFIVQEACVFFLERALLILWDDDVLNVVTGPFGIGFAQYTLTKGLADKVMSRGKKWIIRMKQLDQAGPL